MNGKLYIRLFGSTDCDVCKKVQNVLKSNNLEYYFIDALSDETQELCDKNDVMELPHVQVLDENGKIVKEFVAWRENMDNIDVILNLFKDWKSNASK